LQKNIKRKKKEFGRKTLEKMALGENIWAKKKVDIDWAEWINWEKLHGKGETE